MVSQLSRNSSGLAYSNTVHRVCNICSDIVWSPRLAMQLCRDNFFWYPVWKLKQETKCNYRWCSYQNSIWTNALMQMLQRFHCSSSEKRSISGYLAWTDYEECVCIGPWHLHYFIPNLVFMLSCYMSCFCFIYLLVLRRFRFLFR